MCLNLSYSCKFHSFHYLMKNLTSNFTDSLLIILYSFLFQPKDNNGKSKSLRNKKNKAVSSLQTSLLCLILSGTILTVFIGITCNSGLALLKTNENIFSFIYRPNSMACWTPDCRFYCKTIWLV